MINVIVIEPENPGNVGAIARAMKNFDFDDLVLVGPKFRKNSSELRKRAKWANDIIDNMKISKYDMNALRKRYDYLIATTARIGRDYNILRSPITPEQLAERVSELKDAKIGIMIGRESSGLNNEEVKIADFTVTIPTSKKYGTMNMSHAASLILYEIFKANKKESIVSHINPISEKEKKQLMILLEDAMGNMHFIDDRKKDTQRIVWKKMISKSFLSRREAYALMGFLRKMK